MVKYISTSEFKKLKDTTLHVVCIDVVSLKEPLRFKSKDRKKVLSQIIKAEKKYGKHNLFASISSYECKDTLELCDENHTLSGICSFKGEYL